MQGRDACSAMHYSMQTQQPPEAAIFMTSSQLEKVAVQRHQCRAPVTVVSASMSSSASQSSHSHARIFSQFSAYLWRAPDIHEFH